MEIESVERPEQSILGKRKVEDKKRTAGPEHPTHFSQSLRPRSHIAKPEGDRHDIERGRRKRKPQTVGLNEARHIFSHRLFEHGKAKIGSDDLRAGTGFLNDDRKISAARGEIENRFWAALGDEFGDGSPPEKVDTATQEVVCKIVAFRNRRKRLANKLGILLRLQRVVGWIRMKCSREDSNLQGLPHTVLSRTRLPVPPRER